jgi:hypothetical protein
MDLILFAIGLGYLQTGSNLLQRDLSGLALNRPLYANGSASPLPHYAIAILAWPIVRLARRPYGSSPIRTLIYCSLEWLAMAILSGFLMFGVRLFTASTINQALVALGGYAFVLAGKLGGVVKRALSLTLGDRPFISHFHCRAVQQPAEFPRSPKAPRSWSLTSCYGPRC